MPSGARRSERPPAERVPGIGNRSLGHLLQHRVGIGSPNDSREREAERAADAVTAHQAPCACGGTCAACRAKSAAAPPPRSPPAALPLGSGRPLDPGARASMEGQFGRDFGDVRVHTDEKAADSAQRLSARAYTLGSDLAFAPGQYAPASTAGQRLIAHELAHVVQQRGGGALGAAATRTQPRGLDPKPGVTLTPEAPGSAPVVRRADFTVGKTKVEINYGDVLMIPIAEYPAEIERRFELFTGKPASEIRPELAGLSHRRLEWVLCGLDVLMDNTTAAHAGFDRTAAVHRLVVRSATSMTRGLGTRFVTFEREVMEASGWWEVALSTSLTAPTGTDLTDIQALYNPPKKDAGTFDKAKLKSELRPALEAYLLTQDPKNWPSMGTIEMSDITTLADIVQSEAKSFFYPYGDTAVDNIYATGWQYSGHVQSTSAGLTAADISKDDRVDFLRNRGEAIGRTPRDELVERLAKASKVSTASVSKLVSLLNKAGATSEAVGGELKGKGAPSGSIMGDANFESKEPDHRKALEEVAQAMERVASIRDAVNRVILHTGFQDPATHTVGIETEYNAGKLNECEARWDTIETLGHELVHAMVHPDFPARSSTIGFGQIVMEGFTSVLEHQLYYSIRKRALADPVYRAKFEAGLTSPPCAEIPESSIGYGDAGRKAEEVRTKVGDDNFRAAYFLGRVKLVGL